MRGYADGCYDDEGHQSLLVYEFAYIVTDAEGNALASESCTTSCSSLTVGLSAGGTYYVAVGSDSSYGSPSGSYTVTSSYSSDTGGVELEPNDSLSTAQSVSFDESIVGTISSASDIDVYALSASAAGTLTVAMTTKDISLYSSYEFAYIVTDAEGNTLASESCTTSCSSLTVGLSAGGTYYVAVGSDSSYGSPSGSYTVTSSYSSDTGGVELEPNDSLSTAQSVSFDESIVGTISSASDIDVYALSASAAGTLTVAMTTKDISLYSSYEFAYIVTDAEGNTLASESCTTSCSSLTVGLSAGGTYYVAVGSDSSYGSPSGSYTVTSSYSSDTGGVELEPNDSLSTAQSVSFDESIVGTISSASDIDVYALSASAAGTLTVAMTTKDISLYSSYEFAYIVTDAEGNALASESCTTSCSSLTVGLSAGGTYYVAVGSDSSYGSPSGSYTVTSSYSSDTGGVELEPNDSLSTAQSVSFDESIVGTISSASDIDVYALSASAAGTLTVAMTTKDISLYSSYEFAYIVTDAEGNALASESCTTSCSSLTVGLSAGGTYYVAVVGVTRRMGRRRAVIR